jgi:hypothetical protein
MNQKNFILTQMHFLILRIFSSNKYLLPTPRLCHENQLGIDFYLNGIDDNRVIVPGTKIDKLKIFRDIGFGNHHRDIVLAVHGVSADRGGKVKYRSTQF